MSTSVIIGIFAVIILSVIGSVIFHKKEKAASERRQKVAGYRFKADEAQVLYDGLVNVGLDKFAYKFLLERVLINLQAAYQIDPNAPGIKARYQDAKQKFENADNIAYSVNLPSSIPELQSLVAKLNKFVKYMIVLFQKRAITEGQYTTIMPMLQMHLQKLDADCHMKMGNQAANDGQFGTSRQCYNYARQQLESIHDQDYAQGQLERLDELVAYLDEKDNSINREAFAEQPKSQIPDEEKSEAALEQEALNKRQESDGGFTEKKKW